MEEQNLSKTAKDFVSRTILAADESTGTIKKRLATIGVESTPEINRVYRQILFTTRDIEKYVSGVILYEETLRQSTDDGIPFPKLLADKGIVPGIKVDQGTEPMSGQEIDTYTKGLDGLEKRLVEYKQLGARFAKWRAVYTITANTPNPKTIEKNAQDLATYAKVCQNAGIVPIVEPEVLMDGDHSLQKDKEVTDQVLRAVFQRLTEQSIDFPGTILKPNMITSGKKNSVQEPIDVVAKETLDLLQKVLPRELTGVAFLSGGQSPELATEHLNAINKVKNSVPDKYPWRLTASYGRALQGETLEAWGGKQENVGKAQATFIERAEKVYKASLGQL